PVVPDRGEAGQQGRVVLGDRLGEWAGLEPPGPVSGYATAFWAAAGLLAAGAVAALVLLPRERETVAATAPGSVAATTPGTGPVADPDISLKNSGGSVDPAVSRSTQG
ncbi:hypothetical protein JGS43_38865, partial [Streptomyces sp. P01-F02]|nr:hypothetical protein [Streptomyces poriferorum]